MAATTIARLPGWQDVSNRLASLDRAALAALLAARPELAEPPPTSFKALADRVMEPASAQAAYRRLDRAAQQVAETLAALSGAARRPDLAAAIAPGVAPGSLDRPLEALHDLALVAFDRDLVTLNPGLAGLQRQAGLGPLLAGALTSQVATELAEACRRLGTVPGRTKADTIASITAFFADPGAVGKLLKKAPSGTEPLLEHALRGLELALPSGMYGLDDRRPAGWLVRRCFLAPVDWYRLAMPCEVGRALRGGHLFASFSPDPPVLAPADVASGPPDAAGAEQALSLVDRAGLVLEALGAQPAKLLKDGGVAVREVKRAAKLAGCDEREAARLLDLLVAAGLVWVGPEGDAALPTAAWDDWRRLPAPARWARMVSGWLAADFHPSLAGEISTKDKPIPPVLNRGHHSEAVEQRLAVLGALASLPPGAGAGSDAVAARVTWLSPRLWGESPAPARVLVDWAFDECELLGLSVKGALTSAGRLVAAGDLAAAEESLAGRAPSPVSEIVVQADLTAVAAGALTPDVAAELESMADVESRGAATVYRFTEASLRRAFDAGRSAAEVTAFIERHAARGVPQALAYLVADIGRRHGQARVGRAGTYVRCDDAALLAEVVQARATGRLRLRPLAPTVAVTDAAAADVLSTLRGAGYLPMEEDAAGGLVLTRPSARRAPARPPRRPAGGLGRPAGPPSAPDPAPVVAVLHADRSAAPARRPAPAAPPPPPPPAPFAADPERPTKIAKRREEIRALAEVAADEDWPVRFSSSNAKGVTKQVNAYVLGVSPAELLVEAMPSCTTRTLNLARVHWARVLTEAEEEQLL